jgi:hypothetical protein
MFILVLNQSNIVQDGQNNKLDYNFPNSVLFKDKQIAVSSISMFYSWFNITQAYNNNTMSYNWVSGTGVNAQSSGSPVLNSTYTYTITIPDGLYQLTDLNNYLQFIFIQNGTYWTNSTESINYYPFEFILNNTRYAVQINTYYIPNVATYSPTYKFPGGTVTQGQPSGVNAIPVNSQNTIMLIPSSLNAILGYPVNFLTAQNENASYTPPTNQTLIAKSNINTISYLSTQAPEIQPNSNIIFTLSNVNNPYTVPSSIIYSLSPSVGVGEQITVTPPNFMWTDMLNGTYSKLRLSFLGTNLSPITLQDPNMTILLTIKDKAESIAK